MAKKASAKPETTQLADFEKDLAALETIVTAMESGNLSLEESLQKFETGIQLYRRCQTALAQAEQKVKILAQPDDPDLQDFHSDE